MNIGAMDKLCIIEAFTTTYDEYNYPTETWAEFARLYGDFRPISSMETIRAQAINVDTKARLITHFIDGIDASMRVRIIGLDAEPQFFSIAGVIRDNQSNRQHLTFDLGNPDPDWD